MTGTESGEDGQEIKSEDEEYKLKIEGENNVLVKREDGSCSMDVNFKLERLEIKIKTEEGLNVKNESPDELSSK